MKSVATLLSGLVLFAQRSACAATPGGQESDVYSSQDHGFRIERPDAGWTVVPRHKAPSPEDQSKFTLTLTAGGASTTLVVYVADWDGQTSAEVVRDAAFARLQSLGAEELARGSEGIAGRSAPSLACRLEGADGREHDLCLRYLVENGFVYGIQTTERSTQSSPTAELRRALDSFALMPVRPTEASSRAEALQRLAARCGSGLDWSDDWSSAARRAAQESKLVLVVVESFPYLDLPETLASGALSDSDLIALVQERFVPWRMRIEDEAPLRAEESYGIGRWTWGSACLFVSPEGEVLAETALGDAAWLDAFAREVLAGHREAAGAPFELGSSALDRAEAHLRRGELERASELLEEERSVRSRILQAKLQRRSRQGTEALETLRGAKDGATSEELREIETEEALVRMRLGQFAAAEASFAGLAERGGSRVAEVLFWLGALAWTQRGSKAASETWEELVAAHPDSSWAWKAAANLLEPGSSGSGAFANGSERLDWAPAAAWDIARRPPAEPLGSSAAGRAEQDALRWLLANQEANGTWTCPEAFSAVSFGYTDATTAICGTSLVPHALAGDDAQSRAAARAVDRSLAYVLGAHRSGQLASGQGLISVYSIWRQTFALLYLARCVEAKFGARADLVEAMQELVEQIQGRQQRSGGWPYVFLPGDPEGLALDPSASFLSAAVLLALLEARASGANVEQETLDRARSFLVRARREDGSFRYMLDTATEAVDGGFPEACGRGPVCALALTRAAKEDAAWMQKAFERFLEHRPALTRVWGRDLCHTGPQGQGSHYLFFDYAFASTALAELAPRERRKVRAILLDDILARRLEDGSFLDMPGLGRSYGTAMALIALGELRAR